MLNRRNFLKISGLATAYSLLPLWLSACARAAPSTIAQPTWEIEPVANGDHSSRAAIRHLLNRLSYGPLPGEIEQVQALGWDAYLEQQLNPSQLDDSALEQQLAQFETLNHTSSHLIEHYPKGANGSRLIIRELQAASLLRAASSKRQLFELMVDFWSNHFNIYIGKNQVKWLKTADDREVIRQHALGKFRDLLLASAKSPAMLVYLDNAENVRPGVKVGKKKLGLNENYAREVLELHTVGADAGYSQADVQAVARVLTGWTITRPNSDQPGLFQFLAKFHDLEAKRIDFLQLDLAADGGIEEGELLLKLLAEHPKTAQRLAYKLCLRFVSDDPPADLVERVAQTYLQHDTDIRAMLNVLFNSDEFLAAAQQKIKQPMHLLISVIRATNSSITNQAFKGQNSLLEQLTSLGQMFFNWPPPDGYPQISSAWVNTGAMLSRWNLAFALAEGRIDGLKTDIPKFTKQQNQASQLVDTLANYLNLSLAAESRASLIDYLNASQAPNPTVDQAKIAGLLGLLLASPEFQLC
ncbi:MAG: DUF1800 family protein [Chloroflexi bacterium]|nr:DUF1800 family protein [Chloroflexota bacterium]